MLVGLMACGDDPTAFGRCAGELPVAVDQTAGARFTWSPQDCPIYTLAVVEGAITRWYVWSSARYANQIESGVRYGEVPRNAVEQDSGADSLLVGNRYMVVLTRMDEEGREVVAARLEFIKQ